MSTHVAALDGLRGLAATVVVIRHTFNAISMPVPLRRQILESPLALVLNAQGAVQLFFVLSGWVLAASLARSAEKVPWTAFYARRVFRIHLPYVAAIGLAWIATTAWVLPDDAAVTRWLTRVRVDGVSPAQFASALTFPGTAYGLLVVGWTLRLEMLYSMVVPLLVLAARFLRGLPLLLGAAFAFATPIVDLWYGMDFVLGVVAFQQRAVLAQLFAKLRAPGRALALLGACLLFAAPVAFATDRVVAEIIRTGDGPSYVAMMAIASAVFVALAASGFAPVLAWRPFLFLGRISYSLYLVHLTVLALVAPRVLVKMVVASKLITVTAATAGSAFALFAIVLGLSILLAIPLHRYVERPSIALGARASRWLVRRHLARVPGS